MKTNINDKNNKINANPGDDKLIKIEGVSIDLSNDALILRRSGKNFKEKTMIDLKCVESTKVCKIAKVYLLVLAIIFLVLGAAATYPIYLYYRYYAFIAIGSGLVLFTIFLILYKQSRSLRILININNGKTIKYISKEVKYFEKVNNFFDELFYKKHQI